MSLSDESQTLHETAPIRVMHSETGSTLTLSRHLQNYFNDVPAYRDIVFICIGTDRSTGDSLGPLVGSRLKKYNFSDIHLYGTLDHPVHAMNLEDTLSQVKENHLNPFLIGIDACLGQISSVGCIQLVNGPVKPGAGVKKELPAVGDIHMTGVVNIGGFMEYFVLQNTRLSLVMNMADVIAKSIYISLLNTQRISNFSVTTPALKRFER